MNRDFINYLEKAIRRLPSTDPIRVKIAEGQFTSDLDGSQLAKHHSSCVQHFRDAVSAVETHWGYSAFSEASNDPALPEWCSRYEVIAVWDRKTCLAYIAISSIDASEPTYLLFGVQSK